MTISIIPIQQITRDWNFNIGNFWHNHDSVIQITSGLFSLATIVSSSSFDKILLALKYKIFKHLLLLFEHSPSTQSCRQHWWIPVLTQPQGMVQLYGFYSINYCRHYHYDIRPPEPSWASTSTTSVGVWHVTQATLGLLVPHFTYSHFAY